MAHLNEMKARRESLLAKQEALVAAAEAEARDLTDEERSEFDGASSALDTIDADIARAEAVEARRAKVQVVSEPNIKIADKNEARTLGDQFLASDGYRSLLERGFRGSWTTGAVELRTLLDSSDGSAGDAILPQYLGGVVPVAERPLTIADLIPSAAISSNSLSYLRETTDGGNGAATVAEGGEKPESTLTFDRVDEPVKKIATFLPITDEAMEDVAFLRSFVNQRLVRFIREVEEDQILNGDGSGSNLSGLFDRVTESVDADTAGGAMDSIHKAITKVRAEAYATPDAMVIHPDDWQNIVLTKDGEDRYYAGGPFGPMSRDAIWGLRVVVTPAIEAGTALVGAFGTQAQVFRRGGIMVEASNSHADFFQFNKTAIRAEERLGLAVYRPAAFVAVTNL